MKKTLGQVQPFDDALGRSGSFLSDLETLACGRKGAEVEDRQKTGQANAITSLPGARIWV